MITICTLAFLASSVIFAWTYGLYPLVLRFLKSYYKPIHKGDFYPKVSIIIPTYNEEDVIERKIRNTLQLEYEGDLKVIVIDSNSSDSTAQIAKKFKDVKVIEEERRVGKTHALNRALKEVSEGVVIITDANCFSLSRDQLTKTCRNFADPTVGAVMTILQPHMSDTKRDSTYWKREHKLLTYETLLDSVPGGIGEFFAFRRELVDRLDPECLADDLDISLHVRVKGYRIIYEPEAKVYEPTPKRFTHFFRQAVRRELTGYTTLFHHKSVLFNPKYGWYGMMILPTRKLLPDLMPFFLSVGFLSLTFLNFLFSLIIVTFVMLLAIFSSSVRYFLVALIINLTAWIKYLCKSYQTAWDKVPRHQPVISNKI